MATPTSRDGATPEEGAPGQVAVHGQVCHHDHTSIAVNNAGLNRLASSSIVSHVFDLRHVLDP
jgi:hypothetical protein